MQVVAAAAELADANGLDNLTLAQVAAKLGVRLPSLYNHVAGLPGLRRELALYGGRELMERVRTVAIGKSSDVAVIALAQAYRQYALTYPGRYAATIRAPAADDKELQHMAQELLDVVLAVLEPYQLSQEGAIHAVRGLRSIVHGFATLELAGGFGMPIDRDQSFLWLLKAYVAGLRAV